jgi:hypothetical protein
MRRRALTDDTDVSLKEASEILGCSWRTARKDLEPYLYRREGERGQWRIAIRHIRKWQDERASTARGWAEGNAAACPPGRNTPLPTHGLAEVNQANGAATADTALRHGTD